MSPMRHQQPLLHTSSRGPRPVKTHGISKMEADNTACHRYRNGHGRRHRPPPWSTWPASANFAASMREPKRGVPRPVSSTTVVLRRFDNLSILPITCIDTSRRQPDLLVSDGEDLSGSRPSAPPPPGDEQESALFLSCPSLLQLRHQP
jgi:hypothetical protein